MVRVGWVRSVVFAAVLGATAMPAADAAARCSDPSSYAPLVERLSPAVVNISTAQRVAGEANGLERYRRKFGRPAVSLGSGFIIKPNGVVVTNYHVIENSEEISVNLSDGREFTATVVGRDQETDLAVLQLQGGGSFPYVSFGNLNCARVGDKVIAIGNPFGLGGTVTQGIVSARNRNINSGQYDDFIQTDAAINRGNSGGPLFDLNGSVIGVNTAIYSQTGGSVGVGFAVPADLASTVIQQLLEFGETRRGWLGVSIDDVTQDVAASIGLPSARGALVTVVRPDSPAVVAGVEPNDVIIRFNGREINNVRDLTRAVAETRIGSTVPMIVYRQSQRVSLNVRVDRRETRLMSANQSSVLPAGVARGSGLTLEEPTPELRQTYGLPGNVQGVVVTEVDPNSQAALILQPGDVILEIGWERTTRADAAIDKLSKLRNFSGGPVQIYVRRGDELFWESLRP